MTYETDNRDVRTTTIMLSDGSTVTVDPVDLFVNALRNAGDVETKEQQKNLNEFIDQVVGELVTYVQDATHVADDPWDTDCDTLTDDFGLALRVTYGQTE